MPVRRATTLAAAASRRYLHHPEAYPRSALKRIALGRNSAAAVSLPTTIRDILARTPTLYTAHLSLADGQLPFALVTDSEVVQKAAQIYAGDGGHVSTLEQFRPPYPPWMRPTPPGGPIVREDPSVQETSAEQKFDVKEDPHLAEIRHRFAVAIGGRQGLQPDIPASPPDIHPYPVKTVTGYHQDDVYQQAWDSPIGSPLEKPAFVQPLPSSPMTADALEFLKRQDALFLRRLGDDSIPMPLSPSTIQDPEITASAMSPSEVHFYSTLLNRALKPRDDSPTRFIAVVISNWATDPAYHDAKEDVVIEAKIANARSFSYFDDDNEILYVVGTSNPVDVRDTIAATAATYLSKQTAGILTNSAVVTTGAASKRRHAKPSLICGHGAAGGDFWGHHHVLTSEGIKPFWYGETWAPRFVPGEWRNDVEFGRDVIEGTLPWPERITQPCLNNSGSMLAEHPGMAVIVHEFGKLAANVYHCFSPGEAAFYFLVSNGSPSCDLDAQYDDALRFGMYVEALKIPVWLVMGHKAAHVALRVAKGDATGGGKVGRRDRARASRFAKEKYGDLIRVHHVDHLLLPRVPVPSLLL